MTMDRLDILPTRLAVLESVEWDESEMEAKGSGEDGRWGRMLGRDSATAPRFQWTFSLQGFDDQTTSSWP